MSIWFWYRLQSKDWCFRSRNGLNVITTLSRRVILCSKIACYFKNPRLNLNFPEKKTSFLRFSNWYDTSSYLNISVRPRMICTMLVTRCEGELSANSSHRLYLTTTVTSSIWKKTDIKPWGSYVLWGLSTDLSADISVDCRSHMGSYIGRVLVVSRSRV